MVVPVGAAMLMVVQSKNWPWAVAAMDCDREQGDRENTWGLP
jgi:hypothetical protein